MKESKKEEKSKNTNINPVAAAISGAVIGAGAAVAGTVMLKDKNNRKQLKTIISRVKDQAAEYIGDTTVTNSSKPVKVSLSPKKTKGKSKT